MVCGGSGASATCRWRERWENAGKQKGKEKNKGHELGYLMLAMSFQLLEGGISKMEVNGI